MERREYEDAFIPAFFRATQQPFKITPVKNLENRVIFIVEGKGIEIDEALNELYQNAPVPALDCWQACKYDPPSAFNLDPCK